MKPIIKYFLLSVLNTLIIIMAYELIMHFYKYVYAVSKGSVAYGISIKYYLIIQYVYSNIIFQLIKNINWYATSCMILSFFIFSICFLDFAYHPYKYSLVVCITMLTLIFSTVLIKRKMI
ncbi:MAG: hypothetical protein DYG96_10215 [Chlorobi bacterium CHB2]|nr:hypothetical protein [Chlorobi bacterium CHB2]